MATPPQPPQPKQRIIDCPDVREVYSDKIVGASFAGGALIVTLGCTRFGIEHAGQAVGNEGAIVVNQRIALAPQLAIDLANALTQLINAANNAAQQQAAARTAGTGPTAAAGGPAAAAQAAPAAKKN